MGRRRDQRRAPARGRAQRQINLSAQWIGETASLTAPCRNRAMPVLDIPSSGAPARAPRADAFSIAVAASRAERWIDAFLSRRPVERSFLLAGRAPPRADAFSTRCRRLSPRRALNDYDALSPRGNPRRARGRRQHRRRLSPRPERLRAPPRRNRSRRRRRDAGRHRRGVGRPRPRRSRRIDPCAETFRHQRAASVRGRRRVPRGRPGRRHRRSETGAADSGRAQPRGHRPPARRRRRTERQARRPAQMPDGAALRHRPAGERVGQPAGERGPRRPGHDPRRRQGRPGPDGSPLRPRPRRAPRLARASRRRERRRREPLAVPEPRRERTPHAVALLPNDQNPRDGRRGSTRRAYRRMRCGTPSRRIFCRTAPICGSSKPCSDTPISRRRRSTRMF